MIHHQFTNTKHGKQRRSTAAHQRSMTQKAEGLTATNKRLEDGQEEQNYRILAGVSGK